MADNAPMQFVKDGGDWIQRLFSGVMDGTKSLADSLVGLTENQMNQVMRFVETQVKTGVQAFGDIGPNVAKDFQEGMNKVRQMVPEPPRL